MIIDIVLFKNSGIGRIFIDNVPFCFLRFDKGLHVDSDVVSLQYVRNEFSHQFPFKTLCHGDVPSVLGIPFHYSKPNTFRLSYSLDYGWIHALRDFIRLTYKKQCDVSIIQF